MSEKPDDYARLKHIQQAIQAIELYTSGMNQYAFAKDSKTLFASIKQLEIIGEASNALTKELRNNYSMVSWKPIIALRHILVHDYYIVQSDIIWRIIQVHLPIFRDQVEKIIQEYE